MARTKGARDKSPRPKRRGSNRRKAQERARVLLKALEVEEFKRACLATAKDMQVLQGIIEKPGRNSAAQIRGLEMKFAYGYGRPSQEIVVDAKKSLADLIAASMASNRKSDE